MPKLPRAISPHVTRFGRQRSNCSGRHGRIAGVIIDGNLVKRLEDQNRTFFRDLAPAVRNAGIFGQSPILEVGGTIAFFAGDRSPLTQASGSFSAEEIDAVSEFYRDKTSSWEAILSPFSGAGALGRLIQIGATEEGWENVLCRSLSDPIPSSSCTPEIEIVEVPATNGSFAEISGSGFFANGDVGVGNTLTKLIACAGNYRRYLGLWSGKPAAAASTTTGNGMIFLGGMTTLPEYRRSGLQAALIERRLRDAAGDADLAVLGANPSSTSHRNADRAGFRVAFSQLSLRVPTNPGG